MGGCPSSGAGRQLESHEGRGDPRAYCPPGLRRSTMQFLPTVVRAEFRGGTKIHLTFNDGLENTVDFAQWLDGPVFEPLKDRAYFQRFFLDGGTVAWPNGADVAPETLHGHATSSEAA